MGNVGILLDYVSSLSVLGMLAVAFGAIRRALPSPVLVEPLLGLLFGLVAVYQMHQTFEPIPGLIVDLRAVPVILAGAFLGLRGLAICLVLAAAARLHIGGVGVYSGVTVILIAGAAGSFWNAMTAGGKRDFMTIFALGPALCISLSAVVMLPYEVASWFVLNAAPLLIVLYIITVPVIAFLLERERVMMIEEADLRQATKLGAGEGLMPRNALAWSVAQAATTGSLRDGASVFLLDLRHRGGLARLWGEEVDEIAMAATRDRLNALLPEGGIVGWAQSRRVLMAVPKMDEARVEALLTDLRREIASNPINVPGMSAVRISLNLLTRTYDQLPDIDVILEDFVEEAGAPLPKDLPIAPPRRLAPRSGSAAGLATRDDLFGTFDRLRDARYGQI